MDPPPITRQFGFSNLNNVEDTNVEEINLENEIVYRSIPIIVKINSENYNKNYIKVKRSYSY